MDKTKVNMHEDDPYSSHPNEEANEPRPFQHCNPQKACMYKNSSGEIYVKFGPDYNNFICELCGIKLRLSTLNGHKKKCYKLVEWNH